MADLLAMWLAGHFCGNDSKRTPEIREELIRQHLKTVRQLIPVNEKFIMQNLRGQASEH